MGTYIRTFPAGLAVACAATIAACGGSSGNGGGPTPPGGGGGGSDGPVAATITITASGASPRNVTIASGSRVTFVNNDTIAHDMHSDPHPAHTDCPSLSLVGFLQPNQSRTSGNLNTPRACGFHDHNDDTNTALRGTITVQ